MSGQHKITLDWSRRSHLKLAWGCVIAAITGRSLTIVPDEITHNFPSAPTNGDDRG